VTFNSSYDSWSGSHLFTYNGKKAVGIFISLINNASVNFVFDAKNISIEVDYEIPVTITHTVTFNGNGNTGGSTASVSGNSGSSVNLTANGFTKTGHTFQGWATTSTGAVKYSDKASLTLTGDITLYAVWKANTYTVTGVSSPTNGGTIEGANKTYNYGTSVTLKAVPSGDYVFKNWNDGSTNVSKTITVTGNVTYTAYFKLNAIFIDTDKTSIVLIDTQEANEIFADTTKVYG
jgi:uncharacterized repeat protein (TIGR02543 family)